MRRHIPGLVLLTLLMGALSILTVAPAQAACTERTVSVPNWTPGIANTATIQGLLVIRDCGSYAVAEKAVGSYWNSTNCKGSLGTRRGVNFVFRIPYGSPRTEPYQTVTRFVPCRNKAQSLVVAYLPAVRTYKSHQNWTVDMTLETSLSDPHTSKVGHLWPVT